MPSRLFGLPIQFIAVSVISTALIIYLIGWSAQSRIEGRTGSYRVPSFGEPQVNNQLNDANIASNLNVEKQPWERLALFVCPLH